MALNKARFARHSIRLLEDNNQYGHFMIAINMAILGGNQYGHFRIAINMAILG